MTELDLVIRGGELLDGTGAPSRRVDVGVAGDRIVAIGDLGRAKRIVDARDRVVAPGFIDVQSQSVLTLLADGDAQSHVRQGITTEIVGEGGSPGQLTPKILAQDSRWPEWLGALGLELDWSGFDGWFARLERQGTSVNVGAFASIDLLRAEVVGLADRPATADEIERMRAILDAGMKQGTFGLATALVYPPASHASTDELVALAEIAARHGGLYASHVRGESGRVFTAVGEAIEIGERARLPVLVYHLKIAGRPNWGRMRELGALVEGARSRGIAISACQYPYAAAGTGICAPIPDWAQEGGPEALVERLRAPETRARIRREMETRDAMLGRVDFDAIQIASVPPGGDASMMGRRVSEIARSKNEDPWDTYFSIVIDNRANVFAIYHSMSEDDVRTAMRFPWVSIASDAEATSPAQHGLVHPRAYGTFPRVLGRYVRDERVLALPEAIRKMTSLPASQLAISDRGVVREGMFADLVVFDPAAVRDTATFEAPHAFPIGIETVVVNGAVTVEAGEHTGARAGRVVRRA
ncbi:MAG: D-aminoacylase [Labilithrix sp.]|nr:D-aminoacylase [Labilithrix sp.]